MNYETITRSVSQSLAKMPAVMMAAMLMLPGGLLAVDAKTQIELEKEGIELIDDLEMVAKDIRYNAGQLQTTTLDMKATKWAHLHHLSQIKDLVNDGLNPPLKRLQEIQPDLPEWKQKSIDKMLESALALAADANAAILNKRNSGVLPAALNQEYREQLATIYKHSELLVKAADIAGNYARARLKAAEAGLISRK
ncbi:MAG: hypothetical protein EBY17_19215 [Acidobacteriia bacterium]|nr:hypothetical protein [Terriglobia bacterium]